jgi:hypothetical protein
MEPDTRKELEATLAARMELGPEHDEHLVAGFLDRIEKEIDRRVDEKLAAKGGGIRRRGHRNIEAELGIFVPLFIIAGIFAGTTGIIAAAAALLVVFLVQTVRG